MSTVKAIDVSSIHRICSGQVILDLATAVKELVENSLDAEAKSIEIRFKEYGIQSVEVIDDGTGIHPTDYESLALKHHTSKLSSFEDLMDISSFGFRGEALSSLCALSKITVSTCTQEEIPTGVKLEYDSHGRLIKRSPTARERGTSIILRGLFESVPVRHREFKKNIKREFGKAEGYTIRIIGHISKPMKGYGRGSNDRQYFFINGRPCNLPKIAKAINELYKSFNTFQYPFIVMDFRLAKFLYDVNVSPDKRTIFIHNENKIVETLKEELNGVLEPFRSTFVNSGTEFIQLSIKENVLCFENSKEENSSQNKLAQNKSGTSLMQGNDDMVSIINNIQSNENTKNEFESTKNSIKSTCKSSNIEEVMKIKADIEYESYAFFDFQSEENEVHVMKKPKITMEKSEIAGSPRKQLTQYLSSNAKEKSNVMKDIIKPIDAYLINDQKESVKVSTPISCEEEQCIKVSLNENKVDIEQDEKMNMVVDYSTSTVLMTEKDGLDEDIIMAENNNFDSSPVSHNSEAIVIDNDYEIKNIEIPFDIRRYEYIDMNRQEFQKGNDCDMRLSNSGIDTQDNEVAVRELNRVISKNDFGLMEIVGQFNLGFIIAKLGNDLFIIDQHASDEKYNFETLQLHTKIQSQRLISPRRLELTVAEELVAIENLEILQANGFDFDIDYDASPTKKLKLLSQPMSKDTVFGVKDIEELIFLLSERPGEMIVKRMGDIDQPWNCPHGRPTMRHLFDLSQVKNSQPYTMRLKTREDLEEENIFYTFQNDNIFVYRAN
ncbi:16067_t:CDS:10 [Funneliformis mosseae]|uniref:16067_t:CDS:1 n=1 Tax=Funneliformis mosseae TaxID=27381 RepID=A0A9N9AMF1_FUNMO|nr:16067_t:CDS:10 [Funneliformis mosseae]